MISQQRLDSRVFRGASAVRDPRCATIFRKSLPPRRFGSALPEAPFWRGSEPPGGRTQSGSEEHDPLQSAYSEFGLPSSSLAPATLRLRAALGQVHYDRCFGALSLD